MPYQLLLLARMHMLSIVLSIVRGIAAIAWRDELGLQMPGFLNSFPAQASTDFP